MLMSVCVSYAARRDPGQVYNFVPKYPICLWSALEALWSALDASWSALEASWSMLKAHHSESSQDLLRAHEST